MANKKLKLLYLARYLREETDERHPRTVQDMIAYLGIFWESGIFSCRS